MGNINMQETIKEETIKEEIIKDEGFLGQEDIKVEKKEKEIIKEYSEPKADSEIKYFWIRTL